MNPSHNPQCPWCGQSKHKIVDGARCIICDNIVHLENYDHGASSSKGQSTEVTKCKHREDGMVCCATCDGEKLPPSYHMGDSDFKDGGTVF